MQTVSINNKREFHFLSVLLARSQTEADKAKNLSSFSKESAEIAAIILIFAGLLAVMTVCALKFLELVIVLIKQSNFLPLIYEM